VNANAAALIEKWGVQPKRILGYSDNAQVPNRFGLSNKMGHGLDMLVWVPPPPSITVRLPTDTERHFIDGVKGTAPTKTLTFAEDTLLVIETKATLSGVKTSGFNKTQKDGGAEKMKKLTKLIEQKKQGWTPRKMAEMDTKYTEKTTGIESAMESGKIEYFHAQVFFDSQGGLNKLVGDGSDIQLNTW